MESTLSNNQRQTDINVSVKSQYLLAAFNHYSDLISVLSLVGLEFGLSLKREKINLIIKKGTQISHHQVEALPTYDGYYSLIVPIGTGEYNIAILFGQCYTWLQLDNIEIIKSSDLLKSTESLCTGNTWNEAKFHEIRAKGENIFQCETSYGFIMLQTKKNADNDHRVIHIFFRPLEYNKFLIS